MNRRSLALVSAAIFSSLRAFHSRLRYCCARTTRTIASPYLSGLNETVARLYAPSEWGSRFLVSRRGIVTSRCPEKRLLPFVYVDGCFYQPRAMYAAMWTRIP